MTENHFLPGKNLKELSEREGFSAFGAARAGKLDISVLERWLKDGCNASMSWMENHKDKRENPSLLMEETKSIVCFLYSYNDEPVTSPCGLKIASYAQRRDYHRIIKQKLNNIIDAISAQEKDFRARAFVDSAPVLEREWAMKCGLGWIGRNKMLVNKELGNRFFIGEIICNFETDYSAEQPFSCGNCHKCIDACPNGAIKENSSFDARLCTSYQTIENKDAINPATKTSGFIYGCDICTDACIWNFKAKKIENQDEDVKELISSLLSKAESGTLEKKDFQPLRKITAMERIKYEKLLSNISFAKKQLQDSHSDFQQ